MMFLGQFEIILIVMLALSACSIFGSIIILQRSTYSPASIGRASIFGFAIGIFYTSIFSSLLLISIAIVVTLIVQRLIRNISKTSNIPESTLAIWLSMSLFAIGLTIINIYSIHNVINIDKVFTGELAYTILNRISINGRDIGSVSFYLFIILFILNLSIFILYSNKFKIFFCDPEYSFSLTIDDKKIETLISMLIAITVSATIQITGAFMVAIFILGPPMIAIFFTTRLYSLLLTTLAICIISTLIGFTIVDSLNISIISSTVLFISILFIITIFFAPKKGLLYNYYMLNKCKREILSKEILTYIYESTSSKDSYKSNISILELSDYFNLKTVKIRRIINYILTLSYIFQDTNQDISITKTGKKYLSTFSDLN